MPLQRRLPKRGFVSRMRDDTAEVRLSDLAKLPVAEIDLLALKAAGRGAGAGQDGEGDQDRQARKAVKLSGLQATKGARAAIEAAGGSLTELSE